MRQMALLDWRTGCGLLSAGISPSDHPTRNARRERVFPPAEHDVGGPEISHNLHVVTGMRHDGDEILVPRHTLLAGRC